MNVSDVNDGPDWHVTLMVAITTNEDNAVTTGNDIFSNDTDLDGDTSC